MVGLDGEELDGKELLTTAGIEEVGRSLKVSNSIEIFELQS